MQESDSDDDNNDRSSPCPPRPPTSTLENNRTNSDMTSIHSQVERSVIRHRNDSTFPFSDGRAVGPGGPTSASMRSQQQLSSELTRNYPQQQLMNSTIPLFHPLLQHQRQQNGWPAAGGQNSHSYSPSFLANTNMAPPRQDELLLLMLQQQARGRFMPAPLPPPASLGFLERALLLRASQHSLHQQQPHHTPLNNRSFATTGIPSSLAQQHQGTSHTSQRPVSSSHTPSVATKEHASVMSFATGKRERSESSETFSAAARATSAVADEVPSQQANRKKPPAHKKLPTQGIPKPSRPLTAYNIFFKVERLRLIAEMSTSTDDTPSSSAATTESSANKKRRRVTVGISFTEMGKRIGRKWQQLSHKEKEPFVEKAQRDKLRYQQEMQEYNMKKEDAFSSLHKKQMSAVETEVLDKYYKEHESKKTKRPKSKPYSTKPPPPRPPPKEEEE